MLLRFLFRVALFFILEWIILLALLRFFVMSFYKKAYSIFMLYECVYPMIECKFNEDNSLKVKAKFNYGNCKIKFRNALEATIKIEMLVQRALKDYNVVEYFSGLIGEDLQYTEIFDVKEDLENMCLEMRELTRYDQENQTQEKEL